MLSNNPGNAVLPSWKTVSNTFLKVAAIPFLLLSANAAIAQPAAPIMPTYIVDCGSSNFTFTGTAPNPNITYKWYNNFYKQTLLATGLSYSGTAAQSGNYYVTSFNAATNQESAFPSLAYVFKPVLPVVTPTVSIDPVSNCRADITVKSDTARDSIVLIPTEDAYVISSSANGNFGSAAYAAILASVYHTATTTKAYYKFDLSSIPANVTIEDARMKMTVTGGYANGSDGNIYANFVSDDSWSESAITWNNKPAPDTAKRYMYWIWRNNSASFYLSFTGTTEYNPTAYIDNRLPYSNNASTPYYTPDQGGLTPFVRSEYAGDKTLSFALSCPGYDTRWRTKEYTQNIDQIPSLTIYYRYNDTVSYHWTGPNGFTSTQQNLSYVTPGTYHLIATNPFGCAVTTDVVVPNNPVNTNIYDTICQGQTFTFAGHIYNATGAYPNTFTNQFGCDSVVTLNLHVKPTPAAPLVSPYDVCQYAPVIDWNIPGEHLQWYDHPFGGLPLIPAPQMETGWPGTYHYYVTDMHDGCESQRADVTVNVNKMPQPPLVVDDKVCINELPVQIHGENIKWYTTALGGTGVNKIPLPDAILLQPVTFYASQTFMGCESDRTPVEIEPCCMINVPSAFTPNGDGKNDKFQLKSNGGLILSSMKIFNRWGNLIFESTSSDAAWDGSYNGTVAEMGTYFYDIVYSCGNAPATHVKGDLTLVR